MKSRAAPLRRWPDPPFEVPSPSRRPAGPAPSCRRPGSCRTRRLRKRRNGCTRWRPDRCPARSGAARRLRRGRSSPRWRRLPHQRCDSRGTLPPAERAGESRRRTRGHRSWRRPERRSCRPGTCRRRRRTRAPPGSARSAGRWSGGRERRLRCRRLSRSRPPAETPPAEESKTQRRKTRSARPVFSLCVSRARLRDDGNR